MVRTLPFHSCGTLIPVRGTKIPQAKQYGRRGEKTLKMVTFRFIYWSSLHWCLRWLKKKKNLPAMQEKTWVWSLGWGDPLEEEKAAYRPLSTVTKRHSPCFVKWCTLTPLEICYTFPLCFLRNTQALFCPGLVHSLVGSSLGTEYLEILKLASKLSWLPA